MTTLSPIEEAEATRFGMFDEEVFNDIVENYDDEVTCEACHGPAQARIKCRSCPDVRYGCDACVARCRARYEGRPGQCQSCKVTGIGFDSIKAVSPL